MSLDFNVRVYPVEDANGSKPLEEKTNHPQFASKQPIAKAEIALHRSGCSGFCGLSGREPEDYATVFVTSKAEISRALQAEPAAFWSPRDSEKSALSDAAAKRPLYLAYRLGDWIYAQNLLHDKSGRPELGKLKLQHRGSNKVSTEEDAAWRFTIPSNAPKDCLRDLYKTQLQHLRTLLRAVESHPGFQHTVAPGEEVAPSEFLQLTPSPKGILMTELTRDGRKVRQALMYVDVQRAELRITGAVNGEPVSHAGCAFHTLRGAEAAFIQSAAVTQLPQKTGAVSSPMKAVDIVAHGSPAHRAVTGHTSQPSPAKPNAVADAIQKISSGDCELLRSSLVHIINLDEQHLGSDNWTREWVAKGVLQALVQAAANPPAAAEDDEDMGIALIEAVGIMISSNTAARIFAEALEPALDEHMPGPDGSQLLELTHAALSIPAVCQAAAERHLRQALVRAFARLESHGQKPQGGTDAHSSLNVTIQRDNSPALVESPESPRASRSRGSPSKPSAVHVSDSSRTEFWTPQGTESGHSLQPVSPAYDSMWTRRPGGTVHPVKGTPTSLATASPGFEFDSGNGLAPLEASATPGMGKLKVPIPSLRLTSLDSSPISTAKPTRSERRQAVYSSKLSFSVSTPVRAPLPLKPFEATPPNSQRSEEQPESTALERLEALGNAMGQSLIAGDLAALIAHKRAASLRRGSSMSTRSINRVSGRSEHVRSHSLFGNEELSHRSEDTRSPLSSARDSDLGGHSTARAQVTSRLASYRSYVSQGESAQDDAATLGGGATTAKHQILRSLLALAPVAGESHEDARATAELVTSELLSSMSGMQDGHWVGGGSCGGDSPRSLMLSQCLDLLHKSEAPLQLLETEEFLAVQPQASWQRAQRVFVFVPAAVAKLSHLLDALDRQELSRSQQQEMAAVLGLLRQYAESAASSAAPPFIVEQCTEPLQRLQRALIDNGALQTWQPDAVQLLQCLLQFYTVLLQRCQGGEAGQQLLDLLVEDHDMHVMLASAAMAVMPLLDPIAHREGSLGLSSALRLALIHFYTALLSLIGCQPSAEEVHSGRTSTARMPSDDLTGRSAFGQRSSGRGLSRRRAVEAFSFLLEIPGGLAFQIVDKCAKSNVDGGKSRGGLLLATLELLSVTASLPGSSLLRNREQVDHFVHFLWLQFAVLYTSPRGALATGACTAYLKILKALAQTKAPEVRRRFYQLRIMDFLVRELSLEHEVQQFSRLPPALAAAAVAGLPLTPKSGALKSAAAAAAAGASSKTPTNQVPSLHGGLRTPTITPGASQPRVPALSLQLHPSSPLHAAEDASAASSTNRSGGVYDSCGDSVSYASTSEFTASLDSRSHSQAAVSRMPSLDAAADPAYNGPQTAKGPMSSSFSIGVHYPARKGQPASSSARASVPAAMLGQRFDAQFGSPKLAGQAPTGTPRGGHSTKPPLIPKLGIPAKKSDLGLMSKLLSLDAKPRAILAPLATEPQGTPRITSVGRRASYGGSTLTSSQMSPSVQSDGDVESTASPVSESSSLAFPPGFVFTGDVDEDLDRLEQWEEAHQENSPDSESSNPNEHESTSFFSLSSAARRTPQGRPTIPRLSLLGRQASHPHTELGALPEEADSGSEEEFETTAGDGSPSTSTSGLSNAVAIPRLNLLGASNNGRPPRDERLEVAPVPAAGAVPSLRLSLTAIEDEGMGKGKMQAALTAQRLGVPPPSSGAGDDGDKEEDAPLPSISYAEERSKRVLYADKELHLTVLSLALDMLFGESGQLDASYCSRDPSQERQQNILFLLYHHLSHEANVALLPALVAAAAAIGSHASRLLRVLCRQLFPSKMYAVGQLLARGAYAQVHCANTLVHNREEVVVKLVDIPTSIHDECRQFDIFNEIGILEQLQRRCASVLLDYGVDDEHFVLVQRRYRASLSSWRKRQPLEPRRQLRLYLNIFLAVLDAVKEMRTASVVHFDIKGDNILLEPLPGCSDQDFWSPPTEEPPFKVLLADFGESRIFSALDADTTVRNRGTEFIKSPEMLLVANASKKEAKWYDRRKRQGAGAPSDIWSLGCLLFEIIAGEYLFHDEDWIRFFIRVTQAHEVITPEQIAPVAGFPAIVDLLKYILVRTPVARPVPEAITARAEAAMDTLPLYSRPATSAPLDKPVSPSHHHRIRSEPFYASHPAMRDSVIDAFWEAPTQVTGSVFLGSLRTLESGNVRSLAQQGFRHVVLLCDLQLEGSSLPSAGHSKVPTLLSRLCMDPRLRECMATCSTADISCQLLPIRSQKSQAGKVIHELLPALPQLQQRVASLCSGRDSKVLLAGSDGFEGDAVVAAVAIKMHEERQSCYEALTGLLHRNAALLLQDFNLQQLETLAKRR